MNRILVISDFHLTSGKNSETGIWSATEDFFWDAEFSEFLNFHRDGIPTTLVINGDLADFMQVLVFPSAEEMQEYGIQEEDINRTYGLRCTESACAFQMNKIIDGHIELFLSLAEFIADNNKVIILKGNHDIQLAWKSVQEQIYKRLENLVSNEKAMLIRKNLEFRKWFYYIPGLVFIEHGSQYEYTTSFRNFLYPFLPFDYEGVSKQIELDLSSFLVRYFTNRVEKINPLADNIRPLSAFYEIFWKSHPFVLLSTFAHALRYVLKAFSKGKELKQKSLAESFKKIEEINQNMIGKEARSVYAEDEKQSEQLQANLLAIYARKAEQTMIHGAWRFLWTMIKPPLKGLVLLLSFYPLSFLPDLTSYIMEQTETWQSGFWKTALHTLLSLNIPQILIALFFALLIIWIIQKSSKNYRKHRQKEDMVNKLRDNAKFIAEKLNVKFVTFGHTHYSDIYQINSDQWYYNTGTWMGVMNQQEELYRSVQQFTYLKIEDKKANLLKWEPQIIEPQPVVVLETEHPATEREDTIIKLLISTIFGK